MKNAHVLRMAMALLTPSEETSSRNPSSGMEGEGVAVAAATPVKVSVNDPAVVERLRLLLEMAVRVLYGKGLLSGEDLPTLKFPLCSEDEFPLPDGLVSVAACYAAWLFTGEDRLKTAWQSSLDDYLASLEAVIEPIVKKV